MRRRRNRPSAADYGRTSEKTQALLAVCEELESTPGHLPWNAEYERVFGDRTALLDVLQAHWDRMVQAQLDDVLAVELADRYPGLRHVLDHRHAAGDARWATAPVGG